MNKFHYLILILLSLPAVWFLLLPGGYEPHDFHHIADIYEMARAFQSGQFPPRLGPDFMFGFGYPLFNYYYVLPFYLGSFFYLITGSLMTAFKLVFLTSVIVSAAGMYLLLKKYFSNLSAIAGSVLYLYTPFRAVEIYVRGAIGEAMAIALFPWLLYTLSNLIDKTSKKNIVIASTVLALLFITHNYFLLLSAPFVSIYVLVLLINAKDKINVFRSLFITALLAAGLAAYWWLPAMFEYKLVASVTPFVLVDHFPFIKQLIVPSWGYGSSVWGPGDEISFQIGVANLAVVLTSLILLVSFKKDIDKKFLLPLWAFFGFIGVVFMMNIRSLFIWNLVPFTNFIQFPWRLLSFTTIFSSFLAGFVLDNIKFKKVFSVLLIIFCVSQTFLYFRPSKTINRTNEAYVKHFFNNISYSEDYLQLPLDTEIRPVFSPSNKFEIKSGKGEITSIEETSLVSWTANIKVTERSEVAANALNFPGWFIYVDGKNISTFSQKPYGRIGFILDEGSYKVELVWRETNLRLIADFVSLFSIIVVVLLYFREDSKRAKI